MDDYKCTLFDKISFGCEFDFKRFSKDAELFGLNKKLKKNDECVDLSIKNEETLTKNINDIKSENGITVFGEKIPEIICSFDEIKTKISNFILSSMKKWNYNIPTPVQMQAIPILMNNRNALISAPTGSGKTLSYLLPILNKIDTKQSHKISALIILPTKELARQIYNEIIVLTEESKIRCALLSKNFKKIKNFNTYHLIVTSPQRLVDIISKNPTKINFTQLDWLIFDEGDLLFSDQGKHGYVDQIASIYNACPDKCTRCIFSATISNELEKWANIYLNNHITVLVGEKNSPPTSIKQELVFVGEETGKLIGLRNILHKSLDPPVLVFVNSIEKAQELFDELLYDGINVEVMHGEKTEIQRINIVNAFRTGTIWVLITTDLMSRGIDFKGIKKVINYDLPLSNITYIHRIGRTGRAGMTGSAITFYTQSDLPFIKTILPILKSSNSIYPEFLDTI